MVNKSSIIKILGLVILFLGLVVLYFKINPSSAFFPKCPLYATTGIFCPGCGSQRALHDFLHFDLKGVLGHNILFPVGMLILFYDLTIKVLNRFCKKNSANILHHKRTPIVLLFIISRTLTSV